MTSSVARFGSRIVRAMQPSAARGETAVRSKALVRRMPAHACESQALVATYRTRHEMHLIGWTGEAHRLACRVPS